MAVIYVGTDEANLVPLPDPQELQIDVMDLDADGAGRSANGTMVRDRIAGGATAKRKLKLTWPPLTNEDMRELMQAISNDVFFWCRYPDPYLGTERTAQFYIGDRQAPVLRVKDGVPYWENMETSFTEK